jgi:hypothetical protein
MDYSWHLWLSTTASGTSTKLRLVAVSYETLAVERAGMPAPMRLTMDNDDNEDVDVVMDLVRATALGNNRLISAGRILSTSMMAQGKATKLRIGAGPNGMRAVTRAGMPMRARLMMDDRRDPRRG